MSVPFLLAFLTGFYTPEVSISRALTVTVYAIAQMFQIVLWLWAYAGAPQEGKHFKFLRKGVVLDRKGFYNPTDLKPLISRKTF
jgi:hypothetical protein